MLHSRSSLVIYFRNMNSDVYMSIPISQLIPPLPPLVFSSGNHKFVFYILDSTSVL